MPWDDLAIELRDQFYKLTGMEAEEVYKRISEVKYIISNIRRALSREFRPLDGCRWSGRVSAIDGSSTSSISMRLGGSYSLFSVAVVRDEVKDDTCVERKLDTEYHAYKITLPYPNELVLKRATTWNMLLRERETSLKELDKSDVVLIDGSFFGYLYGTYRLISRRRMNRELRELIGRITSTTIELVKSGRVIGVVKRGRTSAIMSWAYMNGVVRNLYRIVDRMILSVAQPIGTALSYTELLGGYWMYRVYSRMMREFELGRRTPIERVKSLILRNISRALEETGSIATADEILNLTQRFVVRHYQVTPVELDLPTNASDVVIDFMRDRRLFSPSTNLPVFNDIVDWESRIPSDFSRDFADEVEAILIKKYDLDPNIIRAVFSNVNPQKDIPEG